MCCILCILHSIQQHVYFYVNCNVFFKLIKVHLLVRMHGATIKKKLTYGLSECALILHCHSLHFVTIIYHILIHAAAMMLWTFDVSVLFREPKVWHETGCKGHAL